jgi:hypothetical protein
VGGLTSSHAGRCLLELSASNRQSSGFTVSSGMYRARTRLRRLPSRSSELMPRPGTAILDVAHPEVCFGVCPDPLRIHDGGPRHPCPWPARRLDHLQRTRRRRRAADHRPSGLRISATPCRGAGRIASVGQLPGQPRPPGGRELPARQPLLVPPVGRDRVLPGPGPRPGLVLLLPAQLPRVLTDGVPLVTRLRLTRPVTDA